MTLHPVLLTLALACRGAGVAGTVPPPDGGGSGTSGGTGGEADTGGPEVIPGMSAPWVRDVVESPGSVTFTELNYHPGDDQDLEFVELHNPMVLDLDVSGWVLAGGVGFAFPLGTVIPAGGFLVVAADPARLSDVPDGVDVLGPLDGGLSNSGERLELRSLSGRLIDTVAYADHDPWTELADGSGFTLAKRDLDAASDRAEAWTVSRQRGGTPGADNRLDPLALPEIRVLVDDDATWTYDTSGAYPPGDWTAPGFDDSAWAAGAAPFFAGADDTLVAATAWVTADNYFALYAGAADGSDLRWVGEDTDGSWTTVEEIPLALAPREHLFLAAWEATGDSGSPQMVIGEVELPDALLGTDSASWEWVLGPAGDNPNELPANAPPDPADLAAVVADADATGAWAVPAVELGRASSPWGGAVGGAFTDAARFVWGDTFDPASVTNTADTYALLRSVDPVVPPRGNVELDVIPVTTLFRTGFSFDADPAAAALWLDCVLDDGAVVYLNGVEASRWNLPAGGVDASTLAASAVDELEDVGDWIDTAALVRGDNVLAVEVHQATAEDTDLAFACALTAEVRDPEPAPTVWIHEVPSADEDAPWVELVNVSTSPQALGALVLRSSAGDAAPLPDVALGPGERFLLDNLDLVLEEGDRLFLTDADGASLLDGVRLGARGRARAPGTLAWRTPTEPTPGEPNAVSLEADIVVNEVMYHRAPLSESGVPVQDRDEEWIELFNRGGAPVDLGGWQLVDAVAYTFPAGTTLEPGGFLVVSNDAAALRAAHPGVTVVGDFVGRLGNGGDRILLRDDLGNPADEVRYFDGGRWPWAADGGGSSLELRDPWADNAVAEAWAASDESARAAWVPVSIRGPAGASVVGPDGVWEELVLGLLDQGEVLIDDIRVVRDPDGDREALVPDGDFDGGAAAWRRLGTHRHSAVVSDPDDPSNPVLRLAASGPTGHMHDHVETTLASSPGAGEVEISFRARWVRGSNQLNSRLYFNRLPTTTLLPQPAVSGTPGAPNSTAVDDLGPTFADLAQDVAVPAPGEPVGISVAVADPDGVARVTLWSAVDGGPFDAVAMASGEDGRYRGELAGQAAGSVTQFYVEAEDALGAVSTFPAAGADSRALVAVQDGAGSTTGLPDLRIVMTPDDLDWLHDDVHLMSNDPVGATVVYREGEVFYDVGVRLKGSQRGRPSERRLGYALRFPADQPFRGSHTSVMIDRSEGVGYGQREVLLNLAMTRAGSVSGEHNDLVQLIAPRATYTGPAELQLDRFSGLVLDAQFEDGADGTRFEYELVYYPTTTDDGTPEGYKRPQPDLVVGAPITWLSDDKEDWRWIWLIKNRARQDDYSGPMALGALFDLPTDQLLARADEVIDVDQWLRAFAMSTLAGVTDQYGGAGSQHNAQFYVRPSDGRVLFFPHDLDFYGGATMGIVNNGDLARLLEDPANLRAYYGHLNDLLATSYTTAWLGPWCDQLGALLPRQDFDSHCAYMDARAEFVRSGSSQAIEAVFPPVDFRITTAGGADFSTSRPVVTLEGDGWVDVRGIERDGAPLDVTWLDARTWAVDVALDPGDNAVSLRAVDLRGAPVGSDAVSIRRE